MSVATRDKAVLLFGLITYGMGQSLLFVIFGPLARDIGLSEPQFGILIAASNMALVFSSPRWGRASQSFGRKPVFMIGLLGFAAGYALLAAGLQLGLAGGLSPAPLFLLLLGARLIYGIACGGIQPAATAYIADITDDENRASGMALIAASGGIGTIVGPAFGGALAGLGAVVPMYSAAALAVIAVLCSMFLLTEPQRNAVASADVRVRFSDRRVFPYLFGWFAVFGVFTAVQVITPFYIEDHFAVVGQGAVIRTVMIALLAMALVTLLVQIVVMQTWRPGPGVMLRSGFLIMGAALIMLAFASQVFWLYIVYAFMGLSLGMVIPGLNAAATISVDPQEQGAVAGLLSAAPTLGMVVGPILGGMIYGYSAGLPILAGGITCLSVGIWFRFVRIPGG